MFATKEMISYRKKEARKLQNELMVKLTKVQKLVIKRVLRGEDVVFEISSFAKAATLRGIGDINAVHKYYRVNLKHYDHRDFEYDNAICVFYKEQHNIVNYWIKLLA